MNVAFGPMKTSSSIRTPSQSCTPHLTVTRSPTDDVVLDERVIADVAVGADARAGQHVGERPDARARPDRLRFAERLRMQEDRALTAALPAAPLAHDVPSLSNVRRRRTIASGRALVFSNARHAYAPTTDRPSALSAPKPAISSTVVA